MAEQENADGFSPHAGNQLAFDGFLGHQAHRSAGATLWRVTADHGDQPPFLVVVQHLRRAGPLPLIQYPFQTTILIPVGDVPNRLRGERNHRRDTGAH